MLGKDLIRDHHPPHCHCRLIEIFCLAGRLELEGFGVLLRIASLRHLARCW